MRRRCSLGAAACAGAAVAGVLFAGSASAQTYRDSRPIRGVWFRGNGAVSGTAASGGLDANLQNFANAGVTDLFLDTLYGGHSVGRAGVFRALHSTDYLQTTIINAARYGIRVHAWCESSFLAYGSTGAYNFTINPPGQSEGNPEWRVISSATGQPGGDYTIPGAVFGNLGHPGLQAKLRAYFAELATYKGLWGVQTDYHRYPLDDNSADANPAPWSFDTYSRNAFMAVYGPTNDPLTTANTTTAPQYNNFLAWRRAGISECARQMKLGIDSVDPRVVFSVAMFAVPVTSKCSDWATWAANGYIEWLVPMCYGPSTFSITNDLTIVTRSASGRRVVAGLYTNSTTNHPTFVDQVNACNGVGVQDWVFFSGPTFTVPANVTTLAGFVTTTATKQRGDLNNDGYIDSADWNAFRAVYTGSPVPAGANARLDYTGDAQIDESDWTLFKREFARWRFGEDGIVDQRSLDAFLQCLNATQGASPRKHLYDLNGDGSVSYADQTILHQLLTSPVSPDADVNRDGVVDLADVYRQLQSPIDVNRDGVVDPADLRAAAEAARFRENVDMTIGKR
jgi:uncharacterized lipoprotein YddW (UPF0748 family)